jgi:hypothetical protein
MPPKLYVLLLLHFWDVMEIVFIEFSVAARCVFDDLI